MKLFGWSAVMVVVIAVLTGCEYFVSQDAPKEVASVDAVEAVDVTEAAPTEDAKPAVVEEAPSDRGLVACDAGGQIHEAPYLREISDGFVGVDSKLEIRWYPKPQCKAILMTNEKQKIADVFAMAKVLQRQAREHEDADKKANAKKK